MWLRRFDELIIRSVTSEKDIAPSRLRYTASVSYSFKSTLQFNERRQTMLFVALLKATGGTPKETTARRVQWQYPEGVRVVAEYWLQGNPRVISIIEADSIAPIMAVAIEWGDVFDITVLPAITAEDGLQLAKQMMQG
jgi:uncharacterized protein with GYD domain